MIPNGIPIIPAKITAVRETRNDKIVIYNTSASKVIINVIAWIKDSSNSFDNLVQSLAAPFFLNGKNWMYHPFLCKNKTSPVRSIVFSREFKTRVNALRYLSIMKRIGLL